MKFTDNLQEFTEVNLLPGFDTWNEAADFLEVPFVNGGAMEAIRERISPATNKNDALAELLAGALNPYFKGPQMDEAKIIELIKQHSKPFTEKTNIYINDQEAGSVAGKQHKSFDQVLRFMAAGLNVYLYGPAGTGKTQLAENAAEILNKSFFSISVCAQSTKSDLLGYMNAGGLYVGTLFREAYENGGVFLLDEIDNGNPNVLAVLNSALANGYCAFSDKMVKKHEDFILVASANTFGTGPDRMYIGRNQLDAATLNRFIQVEIGYDQELEKEIFGDIAEDIQLIREKLKNERVIISMRNISHAAKLQRSGFSRAEAIQYAVINTIPENLRSRV